MTIEHLGELQSLLSGTVIRDAEGDFARLNPYGFDETRWFPAWVGDPYEQDYGVPPHDIPLPAVVVWSPLGNVRQYHHPAVLAVTVLSRYIEMLARLQMDTPADQHVTDQMIKLGDMCAQRIARTCNGVTEEEIAFAENAIRLMVAAIEKAA